ncbi:hypothetical protein M8C21_003893 [Ambrosia artemisiifolia]|uniref:Uncharacterized protein n=1 Tax=Ambrosia artemisiifolia TaxID=4212 RepID=A0AAD5CN23_AMBAR|nr:hypothetical protein M8C21_003893 [Ambrosia artemisiifolia]
MNRLQVLVLFIATLLLFTSSITAVDSTTNAAEASPASADPSSLGCDDKCGKRCANASNKERCLKYCGVCCGKCQGCVPSGPYADKAECPCYRDLKNPKGKDKCP